ncbi:unnamed protein product [Toxocara canis]|uniref:Uncharacterized protein n=1 Tax=Toxocara canis TaxID=6265 RepID=A0A183UII2_TOXCA|nr:unnamed protein product [Toxocara canis]
MGIRGNGGHNPSPYLRRYRLPQLGSGASAYEQLLSPVDNSSKMAFISALNFQKKNFQLSTPVLRSPSVPLPTTSSSISRRRMDEPCAQNDHKSNDASNATNTEQRSALLAFDIRLEIAELELRNSRLIEEYSKTAP